MAAIVCGEIDTVALLILGNHPINDSLIEVIAAQMRVAVCRQHLYNAISNLQNGDIECAAAKVRTQNFWESSLSSP